MPFCPTCDNRAFPNREALIQHLSTSSAPHPFCTECNRRFIDTTGFEAHMAAKHPPVYRCLPCDKAYLKPFALEDHFRGSPAHPNCALCGRGFRDFAASEEHNKLAHPRVECRPCGITLYEEALQKHYLDPNNSHPICRACEPYVGFSTTQDLAEHDLTSHAKFLCLPCKRNFETEHALQIHLWTLTSKHPRCDACSIGFEDDEAFRKHLEKKHEPRSSPDVDAPPDTEETKSVLGLSSTTTPSVTNNLDAPSNQHESPKEDLITAVAKHVSTFSPKPKTFRELIANNMLQSAYMSSPTLSVSNIYNNSPIQAVPPPFSPILPPPGQLTSEIWSARDNLRVSDWRARPVDRPQQNRPRLQSICDEDEEDKTQGDGNHSFRPGLSKLRTDKGKLTPLFAYERRPLETPQSPEVFSPIGLACLPSISPIPPTPSILERSTSFNSTLFSFGTPFPTSSRTTLPPLTSPSSAPSSIDSVGSRHISLPTISTEKDGGLSNGGGDGGKVNSGDRHQLEDNNSSNDVDEHDGAHNHTQTMSVVGKVPLGSQLLSTTPIRVDSSHSEKPSAVIATKETTVDGVVKSEGTSDTAVASTLSLHCRICKKERCVETTATMCGHIFCKTCITDAVVTTSRCPVCSTPTLLYCLFKLDLEAR